MDIAALLAASGVAAVGNVSATGGVSAVDNILANDDVSFIDGVSEIKSVSATNGGFTISDEGVGTTSDSMLTAFLLHSSATAFQNPQLGSS